jgi:arylsulfatase
MECFAGFLSHADAQIGRVLDFVDALGEADDTLVVAISDNGASAEGGARGSINDARLWNGAPAGRKELRERIGELGGPTAHNNYPWGWTMAGNTPFRRWKREVHEGGIADPCIVRWPSRIAARGEVRHQFAHAIDVLPTVLELIGVDAPSELDGIAQRPLEGTSFAYLLGPEGAGAPERHTTQHFEMLGSRGIYHEGWKAVTFKPLGPMYDDGLDPDAPFDDDVWELFHVDADPTECDDLAATHPDTVAALVERWWDEARRFAVLPLDNRPIAALLEPRRAPDDRTELTYWPHGALVPETVAANLRNRPHLIATTLDAPADGTILAMGTTLGGWALQVHGGCLRYVHNHLGRTRHVVTAAEPLAPGLHDVALALSTAGDLAGTAVLLVDGHEVARGDIPQLTAVRYSITGGGMTCGWEQGPAIGDDYRAPFPFTGALGPVTVTVFGPEHRDPEMLLASILAEQ